MNIDLYTLCWNEMDILPFVIDYWKRFVRKAYVYDNGSTDGSVEYLKQFDWIEVRSFETDGMDDIRHINIKNECWKDSDADFVCVCDLDELIFSDELENELQYMKDNDYNILGCKWFCIRNDNKPKYKEGKLLHELCNKFFMQDINNNDHSLGKFLIFDPHKITDINYNLGCHEVVSPKPKMNLYISNKIYEIHIDKGFGEKYFANRRKIMNDRLSESNKRNNLCYQYKYPEDQQKEEYRENQNEALNLNEIIEYNRRSKNTLDLNYIITYIKKYKYC